MCLKIFGNLFLISDSCFPMEWLVLHRLANQIMMNHRFECDPCMSNGCVCLVKPLESSIMDLTLEWIEIFEVIDV